MAETVARIFARPLDRSRPLWELYLIHGLSDGRVAMLSKMHHSMVDVSRLRGLAGADEDPAILEVTTARVPKTSFNGPVSSHRRFAFGSLSLESVKRLKNELGTVICGKRPAAASGSRRRSRSTMPA